MNRPKRARISTRNYDDFYYPKLKKRKRTEEKNQENEQRNQSPSKSPSTNSILNQLSAQVQRPNPANIANLSKTQSQNTEGTQTTSPRSPRTTVASTQTNQKTPRSLKEILNELYTNPKYPSVYGGQLRKFILSKDSISKHRQRRKIFKRRKV